MLAAVKWLRFFSPDRTSERLRLLVVVLVDRLPSEHVAVVTEYLDVGEPGLALEHMADMLCEYEQTVTSDERVEMLSLARRMGLDDRVASALSLCGER